MIEKICLYVLLGLSDTELWSNRFTDPISLPSSSRIISANLFWCQPLTIRPKFFVCVQISRTLQWPCIGVSKPRFLHSCSGSLMPSHIALHYYYPSLALPRNNRSTNLKKTILSLNNKRGNKILANTFERSCLPNFWQIFK
jgi:hypothetical protein